MASESGNTVLYHLDSLNLSMFEENKEAIFFSSNEELLEKCKYYLEHEKERKKIAEAGLKRCQTSDYSNEGMIKNVLNSIFQTIK